MIRNLQSSVGSNSRVEIALAFLSPIVEARDFERKLTYAELMDRFGLDLRGMQQLMRRAKIRLAREKEFTFDLDRNGGFYRLARVHDILGMCESGRRSIKRRANRLRLIAGCGFQQDATEEQKRKLLAYQCQAGALSLGCSSSKTRTIESKIANGNVPKFSLEMMK